MYYIWNPTKQSDLTAIQIALQSCYTFQHASVYYQLDETVTSL